MRSLKLRLVRLVQSLPLVMLLLFSLKVYAKPLSVESITLAKCDGVYVYLAHLAMMSNNEGLAKNVLFRASLVVTANLFLNEKGGRVSKEVMDEIRTVRRNDKKNLDANPSVTAVRAGECDKATQSSIAKARGMGKIWDKRDFDQWQSAIFQQYLDALKIR